MYIMNEKTGVSFVTGTTKISEHRGGGFEAKVIQSTTDLQTGILYRQKIAFTATAPTLSKARTIASIACKALAENHAFLN